MLRIVIAVLLLTFAVSDAAAQSSFRCGGKIVRTGMSMDEVRKACGSPTSSEIEQHDVRAGNRVVGVTDIHIWRYRRSSRQRTAVIYFDEGVVKAIEMESK